MLALWMLSAVAAAIYCIVRAIVDFRQRKYAWAALGALSALVFILTPVQTHAVKVDLPAPVHR
jgi:hypothetical protein